MIAKVTLVEELLGRCIAKHMKEGMHVLRGSRLRLYDPVVSLEMLPNARFALRRHHVSMLDTSWNIRWWCCVSKNPENHAESFVHCAGTGPWMRSCKFMKAQRICVAHMLCVVSTHGSIVPIERETPEAIA